MKNIILNLIILQGIILMLFSCNKDEIPAVPKLTPESSFSMDFSDFQQEKSAKVLRENWLYSAVNVSFFNTIVSANMVIPTLAFTESFNFTPTYVGDQIWQWNYTFFGTEASYSAKLNGITTKNNKVRWEMYVSKTGTNGFTNFLWFKGITTDSTAATWTIYENPSSPSILFDIAWSSNADHTQSTLKYTYRNTGSDNENSTIEFGKNPEDQLNHYYAISLTSTSTTINIEWNSELKNGRVKSPNYYKDENWHCWDEDLLDAWCN